MKKIVLLLLCFSLLFTFSGCGQSGGKYQDEIMKSLEKNIEVIKDKSQEVMSDPRPLVEKMRRYDEELYEIKLQKDAVVLTVNQTFHGISVSVYNNTWDGKDPEEPKQEMLGMYFRIYDYFTEQNVSLGRFFMISSLSNEEWKTKDPSSLGKCTGAVSDPADGMEFSVCTIGDVLNPVSEEVVSLYR